MRRVSYRSTDGSTRCGVVHDNTIHALGTNLLEQLRAEGGLQTAATREPTETVELATAHLPAPVPVPPAVRNITTFEHHISNTGKAAGGHGTVSPVWHEHPLFSFSNPAAIKRPHDKIPIAPDARSWDYEVKAAAVIAGDCSNLDAATAEEHIAGCLVYCDWSARDVSASETGFVYGPSKSKDASTSLGPFLVTPDELEPYRSGKGYALRMDGYVNGEHYGGGSWEEIHWSFGEMLAHASRGTTLRAGASSPAVPWAPAASRSCPATVPTCRRGTRSGSTWRNSARSPHGSPRRSRPPLRRPLTDVDPSTCQETTSDASHQHLWACHHGHARRSRGQPRHQRGPPVHLLHPRGTPRGCQARRDRVRTGVLRVPVGPDGRSPVAGHARCLLQLQRAVGAGHGRRVGHRDARAVAGRSLRGRRPCGAARQRQPHRRSDRRGTIADRPGRRERRLRREDDGCRQRLGPPPARSTRRPVATDHSATRVARRRACHRARRQRPRAVRLQRSADRHRSLPGSDRTRHPAVERRGGGCGNSPPRRTRLAQRRRHHHRDRHRGARADRGRDRRALRRAVDADRRHQRPTPHLAHHADPRRVHRSRDIPLPRGDGRHAARRSADRQIARIPPASHPPAQGRARPDEVLYLNAADLEPGPPARNGQETNSELRRNSCGVVGNWDHRISERMVASRTPTRNRVQVMSKRSHASGTTLYWMTSPFSTVP
ncbi:protein of unknown function (plasmid) [Streptantibioticus cattleyicolor NRRL 8057 = DSM 46488]|nr:protein of unknown function [Streptantibioticus cattleyicolor NRRL 8057 = DSM 46488]